VSVDQRNGQYEEHGQQAAHASSSGIFTDSTEAHMSTG